MPIVAIMIGIETYKENRNKEAKQMITTTDALFLEGRERRPRITMLNGFFIGLPQNEQYFAYMELVLA
jgi:hypothetical protein